MSYQKGQSQTNPDKSYPYFVCYQYGKGIHRIGGNINVRRCEDALIESLQGIVDAGAEAIDFRTVPKSAEPSPLLDKYNAALANLDAKERRIKEAYIEGIDTKDEYRENKLLLASERKKLEQLIRKESANNVMQIDITNPEELISHIENLIQILTDPEVDIPQKNKALASILEKMEYTREDDTFRFYYIFT